MPKTYSVLDLFLGRARNVRITRFLRAKTCQLPTGRHAWGNGTWLSFVLAWRTNQSGPQPCGCTYEYAKLGA